MTKLELIELVMNSNLSEEDKLYEIKMVVLGARNEQSIKRVVKIK